METGWTDAHAHPQHLSALGTGLDRAATFGVNRILANTSHPDEWEVVRKLGEAHPELKPQFGVHPWRAGDVEEDWPVRLKEMLLRVPAAGVGEIGLDRKLTEVPVEMQQQVFQEQVRIANQFQRPCSVHVVGAWEELHAALQEAWPERMLLHAYSGSAEQVNGFLSHPVWFSFGGAVIRQSNSEKLQAAVRAVPDDRILLETDTPYQHPEGKNHEQEPAGLLRIAERVAEVRGVRVDELRRQTEANAGRFLS
jgi:TatD DNase family protein